MPELAASAFALCTTEQEISSRLRKFLGLWFCFLSPRRRSGEKTDERGGLKQRTLPDPLLHPMEEREFEARLLYLAGAATKNSRDKALPCVKRSENSETNTEQKGLENEEHD